MGTVSAQRIVAEVEERAPDVVALASYLSVATVIDPVVLRSVREHMLPDADAGLEADLWFSPLVRGASGAGIVLDPEIARLLRDRLAADDVGAYRRAREVMRRLHSVKPAIEQIEEEVRFLIPPQVADSPTRDGLLRLTHEAARGGPLERRAAAALQARLPDLPPGTAASELAAALSQGRGGAADARRPVTVRRVRGVLEIIDGEKRVPGGTVVRLAASEPLLLDVRNGGIRQRVEIEREGRATVPLARGRLELIGVDGARTRIVSTIPTRTRDPGIPDESSQPARPRAVCDLVLSADLSNVASLAGALWGLCRGTAVEGDVLAVGAGGLLAVLARQRGAGGALRVFTAAGTGTIGPGRRSARRRLRRLLDEEPPAGGTWTPDLLGGRLWVLVGVESSASAEVVPIDDARDAVDLLVDAALRPGWPLARRFSARMAADCPIDLVDPERGRALVVAPARLAPPSGLTALGTARWVRAAIASVTTSPVHRAPDPRIVEIPDQRFGPLHVPPGPIGRRVQAQAAVRFGATLAGSLPRPEDEGARRASPVDDAREQAQAAMAGDRWDEATALLRALVEQLRQEGSGDAVAEALLDLGHVQLQVGDLEAAEASGYEALGLYGRGDASGPAGRAVLHLGRVARAQGDLDQAFERLTTAATLMATALGEDHPGTLRAWAEAALTSIESGRTREGVAMLDRVLNRMAATLGPAHRDVLLLEAQRAHVVTAEDPQARRGAVADLRRRADGVVPEGDVFWSVVGLLDDDPSAEEGSEGGSDAS